MLKMSKSTSLVYLAGPIIGFTPDEANSWRDYAQQKLQKYGVEGITPLRGEDMQAATNDDGVFKPSYNSHIFGNPASIAVKNMYDVYRADCVLAYLPERSRKIGTLLEVGAAIAYRKPVVIWSDDLHIYEHPILKTYSPWCVDNLNDAIETIVVLLSK